MIARPTSRARCMVHGSKSDTVSDLDPQPITVDLIKIPDSTVLPEPQPQALIKTWLSELDSPSLAAGYAADCRSNGRPRRVRMDPFSTSDLDPYSSSPLDPRLTSNLMSRLSLFPRFEIVYYNIGPRNTGLRRRSYYGRHRTHDRLQRTLSGTAVPTTVLKTRKIS